MQTATNQTFRSDTQAGEGDAAGERATTAELGRGSGSRAMQIAHELRERTLRRHRQDRRLYAGIIGGSVLAALLWGTLIATPRYESEAHFSVRGTSSTVTQASGSANVLSGGAGAATGVGFVDGFAVNGFLKSRDAMMQLAKRVDLRKMLHVPANASADRLFEAYGDAVAVKFNMVEQENIIEVNAFSPKDSQVIAEALLAMAQEFVGRVDSQGVQNALDVDAGQLRKAESEAASATNALAMWRASNRNFDPEAETTLVMTMIGQIEQELNTAKINYAKIRALGNPDHPMLKTAQLQVAALERQVAEARQRLTSGGNSQAARLRTYTQLKNGETFAQNSLNAAREAYQNAYRETARLRRYLSVIARPVAEDRPSSPNLWLIALEGFLAGVVLAVLTAMGLSLVRANRD